MTGLELVPDDMSATDGYWIGRLSMLVACQLKRDRVAREALEEFLTSPVPSPWLREEIRKEMKR